MGEPEGARPLRAPDRSRRGGMGDTARYGGVRASYPAAPHGARGLRWRTQSNSDNNGMRWEAGGRVSPDSPAHTERGESALGVARLRSDGIVRRVGIGVHQTGSPANELNDRTFDIDSQLCERRAIGIWADPDHHVRSHVEWKQSNPGKFTESALELISRHGRVPEPRDDQPDTCAGAWRTHERGSDGPNLQVRGSETLPLLRDTLQFRASRNACTPRKTR
jgi:hypothetical protein